MNGRLSRIRSGVPCSAMRRRLKGLGGFPYVYRRFILGPPHGLVGRLLVRLCHSAKLILPVFALHLIIQCSRDSFKSVISVYPPMECSSPSAFSLASGSASATPRNRESSRKTRGISALRLCLPE